jgi:hypothetical protein
MRRSLLSAATIALFAMTGAACAAQADKAPPGGDYQKLSDLVALPGGPGTLPFGYFERDSATRDWLPVPEAAQAEFPPIEVIMNERLVRATV